jgi:hypothetical protein
VFDCNGVIAKRSSDLSCKPRADGHPLGWRAMQLQHTILEAEPIKVQNVVSILAPACPEYLVHAPTVLPRAKRAPGTIDRTCRVLLGSLTGAKLVRWAVAK